MSGDTLSVRRFGPNEQLAQQLIEQLVAWDAAGRPSTKGLRIRAYPRDPAYVPSSNEVVIAKQYTDLVRDWP
ncbi:MAG TPA: hypothetical protein VNL71_20310 [Chloroflexota bacterium]|nr:hypothetical protein [Chloroflexota bacterium]